MKQAPKKPRTQNVNLQALEVFCEVVRLQSFSRGGETFGISQSAASQLVAHLESELGFLLIDRRRRPLRPTSEGATYYRGCHELLHQHRTLFDEVRRRQEGTTGDVRVASIYSVGLHTLGAHIRQFMTEHKGASAHLEYLHPSKVYSAVLDDEADLGVVSYPASSRQIEVLPWLEETMVLACPPGHRLAQHGTIRLEELNGETFVAFDGDLKIRSELDRALRTHNARVDVVSEFDNIETIKQALEISQAISILPEPTIHREVERHTLVEIPLAGVKLIRPVGIIRKRRRKMTPTAERFVETLLA